MAEELSNSMIGRILIGMFVTAIGLFMVWRTQFFLDMVGRIDWAERNLGGGGSRLFYKLFGIVIILIGFMVITNLFNMVVGGAITGIFAGSQG